MSSVWTCHFDCFACGKEFIVNRLSLGEVHAAAAIFPCPSCLKVPSEASPHRMIYLAASNLPYRKKAGAQVWHF